MVTISYPDWTSVLEQELRGVEDASIAVAFLTKAGLEFGEIRQTMVQALQRGTRIRVLVDLSTGTTDPSALWDLLTFNLPGHAGLEIRAFLPEGRSILHAKFYLFRSQGELTLLTGSANWTASAFDANVEHGVILRGAQSDALLIEAEQFFDRLWGSPRARPLDQEVIRLYEAFHGRISGISGRAQRRAAASWRRLASYLDRQIPPLEWPSPALAYLLGAIAARGQFDEPSRQILVRLRYGPNLYRNRRVTLGTISLPVETFLPSIPNFLTQRIREILSGYPTVTVNLRSVGLSANYQIEINCSNEPGLYRLIRQPFGNRVNCDEFALPTNLVTAGLSVVEEFVRGFAVSCALVTAGTSLPRNPVTRLPGLQVVWLRPKTRNDRMFNQLRSLLQDHLGIPVYSQVRPPGELREPHLKIKCEDFQDRIGFGLEDWDRLVAEGANYNLAVFGGP